MAYLVVHQAHATHCLQNTIHTILLPTSLPSLTESYIEFNDFREKLNKALHFGGSVGSIPMHFVLVKSVAYAQPEGWVQMLNGLCFGDVHCKLLSYCILLLRLEQRIFLQLCGCLLDDRFSQNISAY